MHGDPARYLRSIAAAAQEQSRQVRNLIGDRHWLSDGKHKEALLSAIISRSCPSAVLVTSGFVLHPSDMALCSREQDILILDTTKEAPLFRSDGFCIAFPSSVLAAISVKTRFAKTELLDSIATLDSLAHVVNASMHQSSVWTGAFFFEGGSLRPTKLGQLVTLAIEGEVRSLMSEVHVGGGERTSHRTPVIGVLDDFLLKVEDLNGDTQRQILGYRAEGLACALFVAHLVDHIAVRRGATGTSLVPFADSLETKLVIEAAARLTFRAAT